MAVFFFVHRVDRYRKVENIYLFIVCSITIYLRTSRTFSPTKRTTEKNYSTFVHYSLDGGVH